MKACVTCLLVLAIMSGAARAAETTEISDLPENSVARFQPGDLNLQFYGGYIGESFGGDNEEIYTATVAVECFVIEDLAIVPEFVGYAVDQDDDTAGGGINLLARWYPVHLCNDRLHPFIEGGAGVSYFNERMPDPDGTHFNYTLHVGAGMKYNLSDQLSLMGGARYFHLSNAGKHGQDRNPSIDGFGGFAGIELAF